jgi:hypothetical protein
MGFGKARVPPQFKTPQTFSARDEFGGHTTSEQIGVNRESLSSNPSARRTRRGRLLSRAMRYMASGRCGYGVPRSARYLPARTARTALSAGSNDAGRPLQTSVMA